MTWTSLKGIRAPDVAPRLSRFSSRRNQGFTLIELIIFIVVVGVGIAGILSVINTTTRSTSDPMLRKQAMATAESLLEEILLKNYSNPDGGDTGTARATFDDVDQYNGYTSTGIKDPMGVGVAGLSSYSVAPPVTVTSITLGGLGMKLVTVSVTGPQGAIVLTGYRGNY